MKELQDLTSIIYQTIQEVKESEQYKKSLLFGIDILQRIEGIEKYHFTNTVVGHKSGNFIRVELEKEGIHEIYISEKLFRLNYDENILYSRLLQESRIIDIVLFVDIEFLATYNIKYDCKNYLICCTSISKCVRLRDSWFSYRNVKFSDAVIKELNEDGFFEHMEFNNDIATYRLENMTYLVYNNVFIKELVLEYMPCVLTLASAFTHIGESIRHANLHIESINKIIIRVRTSNIHVRDVYLRCSTLARGFYQYEKVYVEVYGNRSKQEKQSLIDMLGDRVTFIEGKTG